MLHASCIYIYIYIYEKAQSQTASVWNPEWCGHQKIFRIRRFPKKVLELVMIMTLIHVFSGFLYICVCVHVCIYMHIYIYIYIYIICTAEIAGDTYSAHFFKIYGWSIFEG